MNKSLLIISICCLCLLRVSAQDYGDWPVIKKEKLLNDLELLHQGLDQYHSGMYWYTPKDSVDLAFEKVRKSITQDISLMEFYKRIAPLVGLSREDHTDIYLPREARQKLNTEARFLPLTFVFLGQKLFCVKNASDFQKFPLEGQQVESINGETPVAIVNKIGTLFASDGFIKPVKYSDLEGFSFSRSYFYYYGQLEQFEIRLKGRAEPVLIKPLKIPRIRERLASRYPKPVEEEKDLLEYKLLNDSTAYLGIHSFSNIDLRKEPRENSLKKFLKRSFAAIAEQEVKALVIDVSQNSGGTEGNEGLLYSYLGTNYQKYFRVRAKAQKVVLDNGVDKPIKLKTFGWLERVLANQKNEDGSYDRRASVGRGLMAYKKEPKHKFSGRLYVIISPVTYSGGSEFSNMVFTRDLATFVGQETGGGYLGNTSGYYEELVLPNSGIRVDLPSLQFVMNVEPKLPFGSGVKPHYSLIPTFQQYSNGENASLTFIIEQLEKER